MATSSVATLDALKAKMKERMNPVWNEERAFFHKGAGIRLCPIPMPREGYTQVESADVPDESVDNWPAADQKTYRDNIRDTAYLKYGCLVEIGEGEEATTARLDEDMVSMILKGPWEADTRVLINEIRAVNPPRPMLILEYQSSVGMSRLACVWFRLLKEAGALQKLRDWLLADDDTEEAKALAEDLQKWEQTLEPFEALLEADAAASTFGIGVYERAKEKRD